MDYILKRSKRKTVAIYIKNGKVEVHAPSNIPKNEIDKFVKSKEKWINKNLIKSIERTNLKNTFTLNYGSNVLYRGKEYPIIAKDGKKAGFDDNAFYMPKDLNSYQIKSVCVQIYRLLAKNYLKKRTIELASQMSVSPVAIKINSSRTRWGSCSIKKSINYSWRLIMADDDVIDYVVAHELAHIKEMNHSPKFWAIVENVFPNYLEKRAKLRELQKKLNVEDWD